MHEVSIVEEIINTVEEICNLNNISNVSKIILSVGEFVYLDKKSVDFIFGLLKKDTLCKNSILEIKESKAMAYCEKCRKKFKISFTEKNCPTCKTYSSNIVSGYETILEQIEGE
ncbi:hydrogenase maturation nickel metallochaperone HypA [Clostridium botulinum]|uniref:hydrogenase maturation nickel metallochaperone HypA/HybF n=1 Tax=Clostridium botulinum TaxID=1491 RepID=UPI000773D903|nr:hydrogenase maturation nickel metallochaperone HypA [Clostridium botulinum]NFL87266.1 hydrogenase maturation nickel metallochaperone HypA [Clostridium botulinum]NFO22768.1 hydrogenase maturation nickel metallochaperone HypA [Clostridium botulinum]HBJ2621985.1 hydrogenase maturation nickel metallochaperone HypA [Clostridium botulinum]